MVQEGIWQTIVERLTAWRPEVAQDLVAKAQHMEVTRRAKETFKALTGRWPTPLEKPYLQAARVMVEEHLVESYEEALEGLGVERVVKEEAEAPPGDGEVAEPEGQTKSQAQGEEPASRAEDAGTEGEAKTKQKWQQAYRVVFGQDPSTDPNYRERLEKAILLYDPAKGRRWAFEQVKEAEERLYASRKRAEEIMTLVDLVPPFGTGHDEVEDRRGDIYIHIGRLTAQVEELTRRLKALEARLEREATRYGGLKSSLRLFRTEVKEVTEAVSQLRKEVAAGTKSDGALRTLRGEILAEVEERIQGATALWRGEVEPRLKALEEWAKRITEAFRRTLEAKERRRGLFGLFGGDR